MKTEQKHPVQADGMVAQHKEIVATYGDKAILANSDGTREEWQRAKAFDASLYCDGKGYAFEAMVALSPVGPIPAYG